VAKIVVIGASGTIGQAVSELLEQHNKVIRVGNRQGDHTVDLSSKTSIETLFESIGSCDAVVCAAGHSRFAKLTEASDDDFLSSIMNKLMGQVNLTRVALHYLTSNGSITITTGLLAREPWPGTVPTALVNAALEGFVGAAALDVSNSIRINAVSPILVSETAVKMGIDKSGTMSVTEIAKAYQAAVEGDMTGQVLDVRDYGKVVEKE